MNFLILGMMGSILAVGVPPVAESALECTWRLYPEDAANLPDAAAVRIAKACGLPLTTETALKMGRYNAARRRLESTLKQLQVDHHFTPTELRNMLGQMTVEDRSAVMGLFENPALPANVADHIRAAVTLDGRPDDAAVKNVAVQYILARVMVEELAR